VQQPAEFLVVRVQRPAGLVSDALHGRGVERFVLEPVQPQYLVVGEVEGALHAAPAPVRRVAVRVPPAGLAPDEVRHERPPAVAEVAWPPLAPKLLVPVHDPLPEPVELVGALQERLVAPPAPLRHEQVDERRLVVGLERRPPRELLREELAVPVAHGAARPHGRQRVEEVKRPLAVADEEAAGVDADPALLLEHLGDPAVEHEVVGLVPLPRQLEEHVREHGVRVHPPEELHLRVRLHQRPQQRQLRPEAGHLGVQERRVVENLEAVHAAVVRLVLERAQQQVVAVRVGAPGGSRPRDDQHPRPARGRHARGELRVRGEPGRPARVVVQDGAAQRVGRVRQLPGRREASVLVVVGRVAGRRRGGDRRRREGCADGLFLEHDADTRDGEVEVGVGRAEDEVEHAEREEQGCDRDVGGCRGAAAVVPPDAGRLAAVVLPHCHQTAGSCTRRLVIAELILCLGIRVGSKNSVLICLPCFVYATSTVWQGSNEVWGTGGARRPGLHFAFAEVHSQAESEKEKNGCLGIAGD
jgi:hypothetical protein